jgi:hypothetical protein
MLVVLCDPLGNGELTIGAGMVVARWAEWRGHEIPDCQLYHPATLRRCRTKSGTTNGSAGAAVISRIMAILLWEHCFQAKAFLAVKRGASARSRTNDGNEWRKARFD